MSPSLARSLYYINKVSDGKCWTINFGQENFWPFSQSGFKKSVLQFIAMNGISNCKIINLGSLHPDTWIGGNNKLSNTEEFAHLGLSLFLRQHCLKAQDLWQSKSI